LYDEKEISRVSIVFAALSNPTRLKILSIISETKRPLHIKAIAKTLKMDYAAIYRHIGVLKNANLLQIFEVGRSRVLSPLHAEVVKQLIQQADTIAK
jgi:DNA-binding transcriptional ArsR family regulator